MPYVNIHWIKLEKRLLNDYRFYAMTEEAQLIYVKFLMLAAETDNKIPKNDGLIKSALRSRQTEVKIKECINEIKANFPKFKENKGFYFFQEWGTRCNWIINKELRRNSEGLPKEAIDKIRIDKNRIDNILYAFLEKKNYPKEPQDLSFYYKRFTNPIKRLLLLTKGDPAKVIKAMDWFGGLCDQKGFSWTLETIEKWLPEYLSKGEAMAQEAIRKEFKLK